MLYKFIVLMNKRFIFWNIITVLAVCSAIYLFVTNENNNTMDNGKLNLTEEWDKTFPKSEKVDHCKITFHNRYGITLAADMYKPKGVTGKLPAIAISGPFGAGSAARYPRHSLQHGRTGYSGGGRGAG